MTSNRRPATSGGWRRATGQTDLAASGALVRLASVRLAGFRGISDFEIDLDAITTIIGEHGTTRAAFVDFLDVCLGPGSPDGLRFSPSDFGDAGGTQRIRARFRFVEEERGAWRTFEPGLAAVSLAMPDGRCDVVVEVVAELTGGPRSPRIVSSVDVLLARGRAESRASVAAWRRLRSSCPVLVLGADRGATGRRRNLGAESPGQTEIARLYSKLRENHGRLSATEIESARTVLRGEMHFESSPIAVRRGPREILDIVDWRRHAPRVVPDDAVQDVLMRLLRAGLMLDARRSAEHPHDHPIIVVDSPEARLHPVRAARVWQFLHSVASQVIVTTNSAEVVATSPLRALRRLTQSGGRVDVHRVQPAEFSIDDLRRLVYHVRLRRGASLLARAWLLLEGETENWILSEFAGMLGYSFAAEGIACIEFAQCGLDPLIRVADQLAIGWHVLADGDSAGVAYASQARLRLNGRNPASRLTKLQVPDIEHALWHGGYSGVFRRAAGSLGESSASPRAIISRALARKSKPLLAIRVIEEAVKPGSAGVPPVLAAAIQAVVVLARGANRADRPDRRL